MTLEERDQEAYEVFVEALTYEGAARRAFVERTCAGSAALRDAVESLLAAEAEAGAFLEPGGEPERVSGLPAPPPSRISHYQIVRLLGEGGMGHVYLAHDLVLGREVALKVLRPDVVPLLRPQLLQEADSSARVQHPSIATFYEAGEEDGCGFIAMEYVRGETLRQRLAERGRLGREETLAMAEALLEALAHVHAAGLIHRDVKPENIMLTGTGSVKLLDFGIAKRFVSEPSAAVQGGKSGGRASLLQGTPGYMSPEQARGESPSVSSDLFALGAVLYEALGGRPAFDGSTPGERLAATLSERHRPVPLGNCDEACNAILRRALALDPPERYAAATEFLSAVRSLSPSGLRAPGGATLAVIDMENSGGDSQDDWIGSGLRDGIASDLAAVPDLRIAPGESTARLLLGKAGTPVERKAVGVGLELGCRWVVWGTYLKRGPSLQITARLTEVATGECASTIEASGNSDELFAIRHRVSSAIAERLDLRMPAAAASPKLDAYECYVRGRRFTHKVAKGSLGRSRELFEEAVRIDPGFAAAHVGLASVHALGFTFSTDPEQLQAAATHGRRALDLDPSSCDAHVWLGYVRFRQGSSSEALRLLRKAMALDSTSLLAAYFAGLALEFSGALEEARGAFQRAVSTFPENGYAWLGLGWTHLELNHPDEAIWCLEKTVDLERRGGPGTTAGVEGYLGECLRRLGRLSEARDRCASGLQAVERSDSMYRDSFRGVCLCALGRTALDQEEGDVARTAFRQALFHLRGRPHALGGGHLVVQALAGRSRASGEPRYFDDALTLFRSRAGYSFDALWCCTDDVTLGELRLGAKALGRSVDIPGA